MHGYSPIVRLSIDAPLRVAMLSFYENNVAVDVFARTFKDRLGAAVQDVIVHEQKTDRLGDLLACFAKLSERADDYSAVLIITHGRGTVGNPTFGEASSPTASRSPVDDLIENWAFFEIAVGFSLADKLVFLAVCQSGSDAVVARLTRGRAQVLHVVAPAPGCDLDAVEGGLTMGEFATYLLQLNQEVYTPDDLQAAMVHVESRYPGVIRLWEFGDA